LSGIHSNIHLLSWVQIGYFTFLTSQLLTTQLLHLWHQKTWAHCPFKINK
jgi:hypothetical protein